MDSARGIHEPERARFVPGKSYLAQWNQIDLILNPIKVAELESSTREPRVPVDAVQQFMNGHLAHGHHRLPGRPTLPYPQQNATMRRQFGNQIFLPLQIFSQP